MNFLNENRELIQELYEISNPIIKYRIDKELYRKDNISTEQYYSCDHTLIKYWLTVFNNNKIHGREDCNYENAIAKLLEFGLTKNNVEFDKQYSFLLDNNYWKDDNSFNSNAMREVLYPFLVRAGYWDNENINSFFKSRLNKIEKTIKKYGYEFRDNNDKVPKKYKGEFVFKINNEYELLPTIYDLYAFTFYPRNNKDTTRRIERIVQYLLCDKYQNIPSKAYIYCIENKRYYAAGSVYHACMIEERKLLTIYLLSHFKSVGKNKLFIMELKKMLSYRCDDGFYKLDKSLVKEKKDNYYIYSGCHMGLGEKRTSRNWQKIESTFWILKILSNLERNNILIDKYN